MKNMSLIVAVLVAGILIGGGAIYLGKKAPVHEQGTEVVAKSQSGTATTSVRTGNEPVKTQGSSSTSSSASAVVPKTLKPTCILKANKSLYGMGTTISVSWSSTNATSVALNLNHSRYGNGSFPSMPKGSLPINGSTTFRAEGTGEYETQLIATGPGGTGTCVTDYFVGGSGGVMDPVVIGSFGSLPASISFSGPNQKSLSSDGSLAFTLVSYGLASSGEGSAVFVVRDNGREFGVNLTQGISKTVHLSGGDVILTVHSAGGHFTLTIGAYQ